MSVDWRRLLALEATMARRRRGGLLGHPAARAVAGGAALGGVLYLAGDARVWWLLAALAAAAITVMAGPFRMFWRSDASLLGRLPIEGRELYRLALARSLRLALWMALALAIAALPQLAEAPLASARLLAVALVTVGAAALASPAVTVAAGAIVVSAKAQELIRTVASGQTAPGIVWLSFLPAAGGAAMGWAGWSAAAGSVLALPIAAAACVAALVAGARLAATTLDTATREIAALDAVKLAHVDLSRARGLERLWGGLTGPGRLVYEKDVALARRRHPGYYLLGGLTAIALWIVAATVASPVRDRIAVAGVGALLAYALLHARRLASPPIERPRLLDTLPLSHGAITAAKSLHVGWRIVWATVVAGGPAVARSEHPAILAAVLLAMAALAAAAGSSLSRPPRLHPPV